MNSTDRMKQPPAPLPRRIPLWAYLALLLASVMILPWIGAEKLEWSRVLSYFEGEATVEGMIFFDQRLPRVLLGLAIGGALSMTGASLQVLFRNPLAEPWTLGVAGGAAVGAFIARIFPSAYLAVGPLNSSQLLALTGAGLVLGMIFLFSRSPQGMSTQVLLLGGVTIGVVASGLMMMITYFVSPFEVVAYHRWMMGGLDVVGYRELLSLAILGIPGTALLLSQTREYNHLALGEEMAVGHGVDVRRMQRLTFIGAGVTTAACVAVAGPIGFIGMIVPHMVRKLSGVDNRIVLPAAFLLGGVILAMCDCGARTAIAPTEIPVGIVTAVLGGPVFLYLLARK